MRRILLGVIFGWGLSAAAAPAPLQTAARLAAGSPVTVVCFGDSVTGVYYHTGGQRAWPELFDAALRRIYPGAQLAVVNAGISGNTTAQGLARMDRDVMARHPQLVVVMFGLNDVAKGAGPEEYRDHLQTLVARARQGGAEIMLMTPNPVQPGDPERPPAQVARYAAVMRAVGAEARVPVADAFAAFEAVQAVNPAGWLQLFSQTIHPNLYGHAIFAAEAAFVLSGRRPQWTDLARAAKAESRWAAVEGAVRQGRAIKVVAMKPFDAEIGRALKVRFPAAAVHVRPWDPAAKSLPELAAQALAFNRFKGQEPDLVVVAVPASATAPGADTFAQDSALLNASLPFGRGGWDLLAVGSSVRGAVASAGERAAEGLEQLAAESKDVPWIIRPDGEGRAAWELLAEALSR